MRSGAWARPSTSLQRLQGPGPAVVVRGPAQAVAGQLLAGVAGHGLHAGLRLPPRWGTRRATGAPAPVGQERLVDLGVVGQLGHEHLAGHARGGGPSVPHDSGSPAPDVQPRPSPPAHPGRRGAGGPAAARRRRRAPRGPGPPAGAGSGPPPCPPRRPAGPRCGPGARGRRTPPPRGGRRRCPPRRGPRAGRSPPAGARTAMRKVASWSRRRAARSKSRASAASSISAMSRRSTSSVSPARKRHQVGSTMAS